MKSDARPLKGNSIIDFPTEYVCIDIETTGLEYGVDEIIEISALLIQNGKISGEFSSLVQPLSSHAMITSSVIETLGFNDFSEFTEEAAREYWLSHFIPEYITDLTGITNEMLLNAPKAKDIIPKFLEFVADRIIVGHNINFDVNFIYDACSEMGKDFSNDFIDTMRISRKLFPDLPHHRLRDIVSYLNIDINPTHRAEADAVATFQCLEIMKDVVLERETIDDFKEHFKRNSKKYRDMLISAQSPNTDEIDDTNPLFGKNIVFTGALSSMTRAEAFQLVSNLGAFPEETITKKTNYLVIGSEDFAKSVKNGKTAKMKKAEKYRLKGQDIVTLSENTFFDMLNY